MNPSLASYWGRISVAVLLCSACTAPSPPLCATPSSPPGAARLVEATKVPGVTARLLATIVDDLDRSTLSEYRCKGGDVGAHMGFLENYDIAVEPTDDSQMSLL